MKCRNCGDVVDPRRVELGYDYCLKEECQQRCVRRVTLAAVGVNKAADYYTKAEEMVPSRLPERPPVGPDEEPAPLRRRSRPVARPARRPVSTIERLRRLDAQLDRDLERSYQRFERGEITAREMDRERDDLVDAFNQQVRSENIRYRSMLRPTRRRAR